jgi:3-keto steroid reductase
VSLKPEHVDLGDLFSVRALARRLLVSIPKLDAIVLNAGIGGFTGLNWFRAVSLILTDPVHSFTWACAYLIPEAGVMAKKQTKLTNEPALAQVFCANVFGHYMLTHALMPILSRSHPPARIIWTSSLEATRESFDQSDIQALYTDRAYESSKYLVDVLALTSNLPSTAPWVDSFLSTNGENKTKSASQPDRTRPNIYVVHPGICATAMVPLSLPLYYLMIAAFWFARMLGSPWHVLSSYSGALASVWLSLSPKSILDAAEATYERLGGGKVKWGSSCDRLGRMRVVCTEVEGWGFGGVVGGPVLEDDRRRRRKRGAKVLTAEERVEFEELGRTCWREMEALRVQWDEILSTLEVDPEEAP